jgi:chemotaxis signal transduction protein
MDYLACRLGLMQLGIPRTAVLEVLEVGELSAIPGSHPWVAGVGLVRGTATLFVALDGQRTRHAKAVRVPLADVGAASGASSRSARSSFLALLVDDTGRFVEVDAVDGVVAADTATAVEVSSPYFANVGQISSGVTGLASATFDSAKNDQARIWMYQPVALAKALG